MNTAKYLVSALFFVAGAANAGLTFVSTGTGTRTETFNGIAGLTVAGAVNSTLSLGSLNSTELGTVTYTYLGNESGYTNRLLTINGATLLTESNAVGTTISKAVTQTGALNFKFVDNHNGYAVNGGTWSNNTSIGLIGTNLTISAPGAAGTYAYVIGFNDGAGKGKTLGDWDDFVVGINFTPAVTPVPEPETYALLLAGLGLMGAIARRRKANVV
jgi:hypothetical protein